MNTRILLTLSALAGLAVVAHGAELFSFGGFQFTETATSLNAFSNIVTVPMGESATFKPTGQTFSNVEFTMTTANFFLPPGTTSTVGAPGPTFTISGTAAGSSTRLNLITISSDFFEYGTQPHQLGAANDPLNPTVNDFVTYTSDLFTQNDDTANNYNFGLTVAPGAGFTGGEILVLGNVIPNNPVPEPTTLAALGLGGLAVLRRRRRS